MISGLRFAGTGLVLCLGASLLGAQATESFVGAEPLAEWRLPPQLAEISGLAMTDDQRLFAIDDERAIIYQIDYREGRLIKAFALGPELPREDFEGLAIIGRRFFLLTSDARLFEAPEGADGERVPFTVTDTGLGSECEFEGLTSAADSASLLLLCKNVRKSADIDVVTLFEWRLDAQPNALGASTALPVDAIRAALGTRRLRPSGVALHPRRGTLVVVAARERALIELETGGELLNAVLLPGKKRHRQTEGIEFTAQGALLLADEANKGPPRLTMYSGAGEQED